MKLFIGVDVAPLNGYTTVDPVGSENTISVDFRSLDSVCEPAECTEIRAPNILNFIHGSELYSVLANWVSKLRHGGKLIVGGSELLECCKSVMLGQINVAEANKLFYNEKRTPWHVNFGMYECNEIVGLLTDFGLRIEKKRINGNTFVIEAYRE